MSKSLNQRRDPFARLGTDTWDTPGDPLASIRLPEKKKRGRGWETENRSYSYRIPASLHDEALALRENLKSIVAFDEDGDPRADRTSVDDVAVQLIDYALQMAREENLTFAPTRTGKMTLRWEKAEKGWTSPAPIQLKKVKKPSAKKSRDLVLSYRWSEEVHAEIEKLAGKTDEVKFDEAGRRINNPHRYMVPIGEVVVRLLERGVADYVARKIRLTSSQEAVSQKVTGWSK